MRILIILSLLSVPAVLETTIFSEPTLSVPVIEDQRAARELLYKGLEALDNKQYRQAIKYFNLSFELSEKIDDNLQASLCLSYIARAYTENRLYSNALEYRQEQLQLINKEINNLKYNKLPLNTRSVGAVRNAFLNKAYQYQIKALNALGDDYRNIDRRKARYFYGRALEVSREIDDRYLEKISEDRLNGSLDP